MSMKSRPVRYAVTPSMEPTDRSTLREMITTASPIARSSRIDGVSSRSRQPLPPNRNVWLERVAAATTNTSTSRIENSRDRTTVLKARWPGDIRLGATS